MVWDPRIHIRSLEGRLWIVWRHLVSWWGIHEFEGILRNIQYPRRDSLVYCFNVRRQVKPKHYAWNPSLRRVPFWSLQVDWTLRNLFLYTQASKREQLQSQCFKGLQSTLGTWDVPFLKQLAEISKFPLRLGPLSYSRASMRLWGKRSLHILCWFPYLFISLFACAQSESFLTW